MKNFTRYKFLLFLPVFVAFLAFGVQAQCPTIPNATFSSTDVTCFGANDGTVTVELGDGTGPFNYFLFDLNQGQFLLTATRTIGPANKVVFSDLPASDYIVQVRKTGCAKLRHSSCQIFFFFSALEKATLSFPFSLSPANYKHQF